MKFPPEICDCPSCNNVISSLGEELFLAEVERRAGASREEMLRFMDLAAISWKNTAIETCGWLCRILGSNNGR